MLKRDDIRLGLALGFIAPIISLGIYYLVKFYPLFSLKDFFDFSGQTKILELESDAVINKNIFDNFKLQIKKSYEL